MSNIKQIETTGTADGIVSLATFPYNPLACQIQVMRFYNAQGDDITDTLTSGKVLYEFRASDKTADAEWRPFDIAKRNVLTDGTNAIPKVTASLVREIRATFTDFPAGTTFKAVSMCQYDAMPELDARIVGGTQAINVQFFPEANSKNGTQYEAAFRASLGAAGTETDTAYIIISVGAQPVAVKDTTLQFKSLEFENQLYVNPDFTGGTEIPVYNLNDALAVPDDITILADGQTALTVNSPGTPISPNFSTLGSLTVGNRVLSNIASTAGVERILWRNRSYCWRFTNLDPDNPCLLRGIATWYQGGLSIEL